MVESLDKITEREIEKESPCKVEFRHGNSVDSSGETLGYIDYLRDKIILPRFNMFKEWYKSSIHPILERVQSLLMIDAYEHELAHYRYKELSEGKVEARRRREELEFGSPEDMTNTYLHQMRLEGGGKGAQFSKETQKYDPDLGKRIAAYNDDENVFSRAYKSLGAAIERLFYPDPDYAFGEV